jgi:hypothetical protein
MSQAQNTPPPPGSRISEQENEIPIATIRDFLKRVLADDAIADQVNELLFDHVVLGKYHPSVVASSLVGPIEEMLRVATAEDWQLVADDLIAEARELQGEDSPSSRGGVSA